MINDSRGGFLRARAAGCGRGRSGFPAFPGGPAVRSGTASLLVCCLICCLPSRVRGETITRRHLDAGRVQFSGIDLNGDKIPDAIAQDNIKKTITFFLADQKRSLKRIDPLALPDEERRLLPDALTEQDLDGDEVRDLLIYNREYLKKYADNEAVFVRLLGNAIYIGQAKDTYQSLDGSALTPEARKAIVEKAREIVLQNLPD
jgi:hypothetical protein